MLSLDSSRHSPITCHVALTGSGKGDIRNVDCAWLYPLVDARAVTLSPPPVHTKFFCLTGRMATQRDVEFNQIFLDACVLLDDLWLKNVLIATHYSSPGSSASQSAGRGCVNSFVVLRSDVAQELSSNSSQIAESHGRLSEQRVEVTGSCLSIHPYFLMPR
jgi:hypothetical protein